MSAFFVAALLGVATLIGCAPARPTPLVSFLQRPTGPVVLPIRDPLGEPAFEVEGTVGAGDRKQSVWMLVDSGHTALSLPRSVVDRLGLEGTGVVRTRAVGSTSLEELVEAEIELGQLRLGSTRISVARRLAVLGQAVLRQSMWEVSWTRGTLTLNAEPWLPGEALLRIPLRERPRVLVDDALVSFGGAPRLMLFDTGALVSALPKALGRRLGLPSEPFDGSGFAGAAGRVPVDRAFIVTLGLGTHMLPGQRLVALPDGALSLLGVDVLSRFDFLVVPGEALLLKPLGDVRAATSSRLARWPWLPSCETAGCFKGVLIPEPNGARLRLSVERAVGRPLAVTLVCDEAGSPPPAPSLATLMTRGSFRPPFRRIVVRFASIAAGEHSLFVPHADRFWFSSQAEGCTRLGVLDIVPESETQGVAPTPRATLLP